MKTGDLAMSYTVRSSERTRSSGAEHETKALLYLMNLRSDSNEIHYFVVNFFNDLTGMVGLLKVYGMSNQRGNK